MILRLPAGVLLLVALGSAVSVAVAALPIVSRLSAADQVWTAAARDASKTALVALRADLSPILEFAPFGRAVVQTPATDAPKAGAKSVLTLQGISASPNPSGSRAIIAGGEGQSESYAIGDTVAPGQILKGIANDHVILDISGETQRLDFPTGPAALNTAAAAPTGSTKLQNLIPSAQTAPDDLAGTITALRDQLQRNPQAVLDRYGITATGEGYKISDRTPDAILQVGLEPGDLVTGLNGHKVGALLADRAVLDEVAGSGQAEIVVQRAGQSISLSVPLQ